MMMLDDGQEQGACIKVIGVGGAGGNAVNTMIDAGVEGVQFIVANTDKQALANNQAETRIQIGEQRTHGLGAGSTPSVGQEAAQESASIIQEQLKGADMVFVTAGMGGGTGTGAAPIIASIARQLGALTIGVVTKPFKFEGRRRRRQAEEGILNLQKNVDTLITIPNERLLQTIGEGMTLVDAFREADGVLLNAVRSIVELITNTGLVNTDFADVRTVMSNKGLALMGTGVGTGPDRATDAAEAAISSPLLDDVSLEGATSVLLNITAPRTASLLEINAAASLIEEATAEDAHLIWGHIVNEDETCEEIKITIIATGFEQASSDNNEMSGMGTRALDTPRNAINNDTGFIQNKNFGVTGTFSGGIAAISDNQPLGYNSTTSGSFPEDIADKMRAIDQASAYETPKRSVSYEPQRKSASYLPSVDVNAPVAKVSPVKVSPNDSQIPAQINDGFEDEFERSGFMRQNAVKKELTEDELAKPTFLRKNGNPKYFLDD